MFKAVKTSSLGGYTTFPLDISCERNTINFWKYDLLYSGNNLSLHEGSRASIGGQPNLVTSLYNPIIRTLFNCKRDRIKLYYVFVNWDNVADIVVGLCGNLLSNSMDSLEADSTPKLARCFFSTLTDFSQVKNLLIEDFSIIWIRFWTTQIFFNEINETNCVEVIIINLRICFTAKNIQISNSNLT